jgi:hypothetical protein
MAGGLREPVVGRWAAGAAAARGPGFGPRDAEGITEFRVSRGWDTLPATRTCECRRGARRGGGSWGGAPGGARRFALRARACSHARGGPGLDRPVPLAQRGPRSGQWLRGVAKGLSPRGRRGGTAPAGGAAGAAPVRPAAPRGPPQAPAAGPRRGRPPRALLRRRRRRAARLPPIQRATTTLRVQRLPAGCRAPGSAARGAGRAAVEAGGPPACWAGPPACWSDRPRVRTRGGAALPGPGSRPGLQGQALPGPVAAGGGAGARRRVPEGAAAFPPDYLSRGGPARHNRRDLGDPHTHTCTRTAHLVTYPVSAAYTHWLPRRGQRVPSVEAGLGPARSDRLRLHPQEQ